MIRPAVSVDLPLAPSLVRRRIQLYLAMVLSDGLSILTGFVISAWAYREHASLSESLLQVQLLCPIYWTAALTLRAYSVSALTSHRFSRNRAMMAFAYAAALIALIAFIAKAGADFSRIATLLGVGWSMVLLAVTRTIWRDLSRFFCGATATNVLVIADGGEPVRVEHAFHIDARDHLLEPDLGDPHMLHRIGQYLANMDRVMVSCPPERRANWALIFKGANISGEIIDREVLDLGAIGARREADTGVLIVSRGPLGLRSRVLKRAFDMALASAALIVLSPVMALTALAIVIEDRGPVLFVQRRTGRSNRFFPIYKFRSMRVERQDGAGNRSASKDDDRLTRVGKFIRRTSIDELPQLLNVIQGDMSIVGPRPHAIGSLAGDKLFWEIDERYWVRHALKPGLTGLAQIRGHRGATDTEQHLADRLQADLEYLNGWTIWRDIRIIIATVRVLVHDRAF